MSPTKEEIEAQLPLTPLSFHILLSLVVGELHGYGILKEIDRLTEGEMTPATGPLYLAAQRLLSTGLIAKSDNRPAPELDDQRRRYYALTALGNQVAVAEAERMAHLLRVAVDKGLVKGKVSITAK